jgi:hypothetical protein
VLRIHLLTRGFATPNGRAFLFPLVVHRQALADAGLEIRIIADPKDARTKDCDLLFVESRVFSPRWSAEGDARVLTDIAELADHAPLVWFDISDSTGWLQSQVLPLVRLYCKSQLLADRSEYTRPHYGNRICADYYHRTKGITDDDPAEARIVVDPALLDRLRVSWNSGLADYTLHGPLRMAMRQRLPVNALLRYPTKFTPPDRHRPVGFTCRMGTGYARASVAHQRRRIADLLADRMATDKLNRRAFLDEMRNAHLVVSPFGLGEITLKDFEALLCGAALLKPDMSHLETWPNLFRNGETMLAHRWDLSDFLDCLNAAEDGAFDLPAIAQAGQEAYRVALSGSSAGTNFANRVRQIVEDALAGPEQAGHST